jgi:hypothetical protein
MYDILRLEIGFGRFSQETSIYIKISDFVPINGNLAEWLTRCPAIRYMRSSGISFGVSSGEPGRKDIPTNVSHRACVRITQLSFFCLRFFAFIFGLGSFRALLASSLSERGQPLPTHVWKGLSRMTGPRLLFCHHATIQLGNF